MAQEFPPPQHSNLAPGMVQVVHAGDTLVITDNDGQEFTVEGKDNEKVEQFLHAFDNWLTLDRTLPESAQDMRDSAWQVVIGHWDTMPSYIVQSLPSIRSGGGVAIPGHDHA